MKISYETLVYIITTICQLLCVTANSGYFIVSPSVFRESADHLLSVVVLNASASIGVEVKMYSAAQGHLISSAERTIYGRGTVKLTIPAGVKGACTLKVCGNCKSPKNGSYSFYKSTVVTVVEQPASVFIQTDKPVYKPGQTVFVNFIITSPDLKPFEGKLTAYVLDPQGNKIVRWKTFEAFCCGLKSSSFELSHQPPFGTWSILAELQGQTYSKSFSVGNYVAPKFEATLHLPNFIADWNICETLTIEAKYGYGKAVHGHATVKLQILGSDYYDGTDGVVITKTTQIHGNASMDVCMTELVDTHDFGNHFHGRLNVEVEVTDSSGSVVAIANDSCLVARQLVTIKFTKDTRKYFRPGIPYGGKLSVRYPDGSLASNITVQIKTEIDATDAVYEDFISHDGLVFFLIKSIPIASHSVQISAKVIKIGEFVTENHFSIYLTIVSWHSLSGCHLLIDSSRMQALTVGNAAKFQVQSNCHCGFKMNYEVASKGNIVYSGNHFPRRIRKRFSKQNISRYISSEERYEEGNHTCNISIKFLVTHEMMPSSKLVVYYFRSDGEAVADVMTFSVKPDFKHKMSVELSRSEVHPGHSVAMTIQSLPGSCICLRGIDKSVYFYNQNSRLSTREVFEGLELSDTSRQGSSDTHSRSWEGLGNQPLFFNPWKTFGAKTSLFAFEESHLMILTDCITVHVQQDINDLPEFPFNLRSPGYQHLESLSTLRKTVKRKIRPQKLSYFPETWIWSCFNMSEMTAVENMNFTTPDAATSWIIDGFSLSSSHGLSLLESPALLRTVKSFFVQMDLPHSVIKGEEVQIPVVVHNHLTTCVVVDLSVRASAGVTVISLPQSRRFCLWRENVEIIEFSFVFQVLGLYNVSVDVEAFEEPRCCSGHLSDENGRFLPLPTDSDHIQRTVLVESTGFTRFKTQSAYFCTNDAGPEFGEVFHLTLPKKVVRGSEKATISVISDPMGLALKSVGELLRLPPRGEEQNMFDFALVLCVLHYLRAANHLTSDFEQKAIAFLTKGYQTQLKYRRADGSYSEFGGKDMYGNIWLTAFFLKSFHQARDFIYIDDSLMKETLSWILSQQNEDGSFSYNGRIMNKNIQRGRHSNVALTAHVVAALSQLPTNEHMHRTDLTKSQLYLESRVGQLTDPYTASLAAYSLTQLNSHTAERAVRVVSDFAIKRDGLMFWKNHLNVDNNELTAASVDIETSGYALHTYISRGDMTSALLIVKWLLMQQNSLGKFSSAQGTDIATSALAEFAMHKFDQPTNLTIHLASLNLDLLEKLEIADDSSNVMQEIPIPSVPTILFARAEGDGCAMIQVVTSYSIPSPRHRVAFSLSVIVTTLESEKIVNLTESTTSGHPNVETNYESGRNPTRIMISLRICTRWLYPGSSNIAVMEISLLSGYSPDLESLQLLMKNGIIKRFDVKPRIIQLYFDEIPSSCKTCIDLKAQREFQIRKIHPVPVKIYDYYEPMLESSVMYSGGSITEMMLCDSCENDTCSNNVSDIDHISSVNDSCDSSSHCCTFETEFDSTKTCSCYYTCPLYASPVCASNDRIYGSRCEMEKDSCLTGQKLFVVAFDNCYTGFGENESEEEEEGEEEEDEAVEDSTKGNSLKVTNSQHPYSVSDFSHLSTTYSVVRSEEDPVASYEDNRMSNSQEQHPEDWFKTLGRPKYSDEISTSQINTVAHEYFIDNTTTVDKNLADNLTNHTLLSTNQPANNGVWEEFHLRANDTAQNGASLTSPTVSELHVSSTDTVGSASDRSSETVTQSAHETSETNFNLSAITAVELSSNHMNFVEDNSTAEFMSSVLDKSSTEALDDSNFTRDHSMTDVTATMLANKEESNLTENQGWISKSSNYSVTSFASHEENLGSDMGKASKTTNIQGQRENIVAAFDLTVVDLEEKSSKENQPYDETVTDLRLSLNSQSAFYTKIPTSAVKHSNIHRNQTEGNRNVKLQKPVKTGFENDIDKLTYGHKSQIVNDYVQKSENSQSSHLVNNFQNGNSLDVLSLENVELSTAPTTENGFTGTISSATSEPSSLSHKTSKMDMPSTELADAIVSTATAIDRNNDDKFIVETTTAEITKKYGRHSIGSYVTTVPPAGQVFISDQGHSRSQSEFPYDLETFSNQLKSEDDRSNGLRSALDNGALELAAGVTFQKKKLISHGKVWKPPPETELVTEETFHDFSTLAYRKIVNMAEPGHDLSLSTISDDHDSSLTMNLESQVLQNEHLQENDAVKVDSEIPPA